MNYLPVKLVKLRKHYQYSQDYLARVLGMDVVDYMGIENGRRLPNYEQMCKLASLYHVPVVEIFANNEKITLHNVNNETTDQMNLDYFMRQRKLPYRIKNFILRHKVVSLICLIVVIGIIMTIILHKPEPLQFVVKDSNKLALSDTTVVYIDYKGGVKSRGDNTNGQLAELPTSNVIKVCEGSSFTVTLNDNGTVSTFGQLSKYEGQTAKWENIVDVFASGSHIIGLDKKGKVYCAGDGYCSLDWEGIKDIYTFPKASVIVNESGIVKVEGELVGSSYINKSRDIKDIDSSDNITVVLNKDNKIEYYVLKNDFYAKVNTWDNLIDVACGNDFIAGLEDNGRVHIEIDNNLIMQEVEKWNDIIAIAAGKDYLIGFDGENIYGVGSNKYGQYESNETYSKITLKQVTGVSINITKEEIAVQFNPVEHASGYQVSLDVGSGLSKKIEDNQKAIFSNEGMIDGVQYTIRITSLGEGDYENSRELVYPFEYVAYKDNEPNFPIYTHINEPVDDFVSYLKSYDVPDENIIGSEGEDCLEEKEVVLTVEGISEGERITKSELVKRKIRYTYCKVKTDEE